MITGALNKIIEKFIGETPRKARQAHAVSEKIGGSQEKLRSDGRFPPMSLAPLVTIIYI